MISPQSCFLILHTPRMHSILLYSRYQIVKLWWETTVCSKKKEHPATRVVSCKTLAFETNLILCKYLWVFSIFHMLTHHNKAYSGIIFYRVVKGHSGNTLISHFWGLLFKLCTSINLRSGWYVRGLSSQNSSYPLYGIALYLNKSQIWVICNMSAQSKFVISSVWIRSVPQ